MVSKHSAQFAALQNSLSAWKRFKDCGKLRHISVFAYCLSLLDTQHRLPFSSTSWVLICIGGKLSIKSLMISRRRETLLVVVHCVCCLGAGALCTLSAAYPWKESTRKQGKRWNDWVTAIISQSENLKIGCTDRAGFLLFLPLPQCSVSHHCHVSLKKNVNLPLYLLWQRK